MDVGVDAEVDAVADAKVDARSGEMIIYMGIKNYYGNGIQNRGSA